MSEMLSVNGRDLVAAVAGPREWGDNRKSWFARAARRANLHPRTVKAVFYGEIKDPEHRSIRRLETEAQRRAGALQDRLQAMSDRLRNSSDPDFYVEDIAALDRAAAFLRRMAGTKE